MELPEGSAGTMFKGLPFVLGPSVTALSLPCFSRVRKLSVRHQREPLACCEYLSVCLVSVAQLLPIPLSVLLGCFSCVPTEYKEGFFALPTHELLHLMSGTK